MFVLHICEVSSEMRRGLVDLMGLELQTVDVHHVGAGNWTQSFGRTISALYPWSPLSSPGRIKFSKRPAMKGFYLILTPKLLLEIKI